MSSFRQLEKKVSGPVHLLLHIGSFYVIRRLGLGRKKSALGTMGSRLFPLFIVPRTPTFWRFLLESQGETLLRREVTAQS